jgi:hypothetical protein
MANDSDKLDQIIATLEAYNARFTGIEHVLDTQSKLIEAVGREQDAIHMILRHHSMTFGQIIERLEAMGHRMEDVENRLAARE